MIRVEVPGQPIAKGRVKVGVINGHARVFTPKRTVSYEGRVAEAGALVMGEQEPLTGPLAVTVFAYFQAPAKPTRKRREAIETGRDWHTCRPDGDNVLKAVADALNGIVWRDDALIAMATIIKLYSFRPRVVVEVRPLGDTLAAHPAGEK